ncbi:hypothetical protein [Stenotrophomonas sp.]|uniref:hypothetical protein n=1 Tax=Stenotrophomonas sp. TaxID=69392 RepID=UPI002FC5C0EB
MPHVFPRCIALAAALSLSTTALAASADIDALLERSPALTVSQGLADGTPVFRGQLQQFRNGDVVLRVGEGEGVPVMLLACGRAGWLNPVGATGTAARLDGKMLVSARMSQYMATLTGMARVHGVAGDGLELPASTAPRRFSGSQDWAYGRETFALTSREVAGQGLQVRMVKTSHGMTPSTEAPDATFSTADDRAARLAELEPVGSWYEVTLADGERAAAAPATMSLHGWVSGEDEAPAETVGEAQARCSE